MFNSLSCFSDTYLIIYRERKNKKSREKGTDETERERTMAKDAADLFASSSPLFCSVCCLHCPQHRQTLTPHPLATSPRVREGRSPRPLLGDVIATPRHHLATDRPATSSDRAAPRRSAILPTSSSSPSSSILQVVRVSQSRRASRREGRERTRAKDAAAIFASSSPLFLLRLMPSPSTPSPAAHHFARLCHRSGRGKEGHPVRFRAMPSPHLATTSPANSSHRASPRRSAILPASSTSSSFPRRRPLLQVVREGHRSSQVGRFPPAHHVDPLHPAGVPRHICGHPRR